MTRLSPAGTVALQCTMLAGPAVVLGFVDGVETVVGDAAVALGAGLRDAVFVVPPPPQPATTTRTRTAAMPPTRTA
ncbi:MAG TPA: hypothetical protein VFL27_03595 [Candidatus Dormibacteraeota bacterium]|nr:hypothetical protein [Candidatus Dormibacteraeota bacterium]